MASGEVRDLSIHVPTLEDVYVHFMALAALLIAEVTNEQRLDHRP
ncbi:hypothetical protein [Marinobacter sp. AC-23]|nr:hypothetical protein [Marinobacter sp. AC-23]